MPNKFSYSLLSALLVLLLTACQPLLLDPNVIDAGSASGDAPSSAVEALLLTLSPRSDVADRPAAEIYAEISPAVAFIETSTATGSGVLIEHGYLLTNAHVVWPYDEVRVVFPDGSDHLDVPIFALDLVADLALVGPIDTDIAPVPLVDGSDLAIGGDIYLIGYPAELEEFPQPTITNGILSRVRRWDAIDLSFFQVDATITGGQSGGIMVTHRGDVIGISTFYFSGFGLASSVADALPRLNAMLAQDEAIASISRPIDGGTSAKEHQATLRSEWDTRSYLLRAPVGTEVEISAEGDGLPQFALSALFGGFIDESSDDENGASATFTIDEEIDYLITVHNQLIGQNDFTITASVPIVAFDDPDDGMVLTLGETVTGTIDSPEDVDYYELELRADDTIQLTVDALGLDPAITIYYRSESAEEVVFDDDSGGGIFGQSAQLTYQAPKDGIYTILVQNYAYGSVGGYFLETAKAPSNAALTPIEISRTFLNTRYGPMEWYESEDYDFRIMHPAQWQEQAAQQCGEGVTACYNSDAGGLIIMEEQFGQLPDQVRSLDDYVDLLSEVLEINLPGFELVSLEIFETKQEMDAAKIVFTTQGGRFKVSRLIFVDVKEKIGFNASYFSTPDNYTFLEPIIDYTFDSFRFWNESNRESYPIYFLDQSALLQADGQDQAALDALTKAIEADPTYTDAYTRRAWLYRSLGKIEKSFADIDRAIELEPEDAELFYSRAQLRWFNDEHTAALIDIDASIALDEGLSDAYNQRALINASLGEFETALDDIKKSAKANQNRLSDHVRDTRAYIYLKMGNFVRAKADYDKLFAAEFRSPYSLLGGAIAYNALGDDETALGIIAEALSALDEPIENADPQIAYLLELAHEILDATGGGD